MTDDKILDGLADLKLPRYSLTEHLVLGAQYLATDLDKSSPMISKHHAVKLLACSKEFGPRTSPTRGHSRRCRP